MKEIKKEKERKGTTLMGRTKGLVWAMTLIGQPKT